jgi:RecA-family ATPase
MLLDGDPGQGKSLLTLNLAARLSAGREFPDSPGLAEPVPVLLAAGGEDGSGEPSHVTGLIEWV